MFSRVANLIKGFFSLFVSGVERRNPEALLELEQENLRKKVASFNQGLATCLRRFSCSSSSSASGLRRSTPETNSEKKPLMRFATRLNMLASAPI